MHRPRPLDAPTTTAFMFLVSSFFSGSAPFGSAAAHGTVTPGRRSQPRTVEVRACTAWSQSTSHVGKRFSTSSRATRPSSLARAAPRQKCSAVAEAQVMADLAADVEAVRIVELPLVPVGRAVEQHHDAALGNGLAVVLDVPRDVAGLDRGGRLVTEELLDGVGDQARGPRREPPLLRMIGEYLAGPPDQSGCRLVAGGRQQVDVAEHLAARVRRAPVAVTRPRTRR